MEKHKYIRVINGIAQTDVSKPNAIIHLTDAEAKAYNDTKDENNRLIKVKINIEKID